MRSQLIRIIPALLFPFALVAFQVSPFAGEWTSTISVLIIIIVLEVIYVVDVVLGRHRTEQPPSAVEDGLILAPQAQEDWEAWKIRQERVARQEAVDRWLQRFAICGVYSMWFWVVYLVVSTVVYGPEFNVMANLAVYGPAAVVTTIWMTTKLMRKKRG